MSTADLARFPVMPPMGNWVHQAACVGLDPALFHPDRGEAATNAKAICSTCPVRTECLDWAVRTNQQHGIWGGLSERARRNVRQTSPLLAPRTCTRCRNTYQPTRRDQRFCSADCRDHHRTTWQRL